MRIAALVIRIFRQFKQDKRALALMFIAPLFILTLMYLVFNGADYEPKLALVNAPAPVEQAFAKQAGAAYTVSLDAAAEALAEKEIDGILEFSNGALELHLEGSDPSRNRAVMLLVQNVMKQWRSTSSPDLQVSFLHGSEDMSPFDYFGPVLVGFFSFFFVFLLAGIAFLRERTGGTLERLLATPLRRSEIVTGYLLGFGLFAVLQAVLIAWFSIEVLNMMMEGSIWLVLVVTVSLALTALTLGTFLSAFASNEFQMIQFIPLVIVPQVFFSGLFDMETMVEWLRWLSYLMPLTYAAEALRDIMIRGEGWSAILVNIAILLSFAIFFAGANYFALRKHRKI